MTPEEETLEKIKYVLSFGNDAQAIRLIEQYGHWKQEQTKQCDINGVGVTLPCERTDAEEYLNNLDIYHHPRVEDRTNKNSYEVADIMADFTNKYLGN